MQFPTAELKIPITTVLLHFPYGQTFEEFATFALQNPKRRTSRDATGTVKVYPPLTYLASKMQADILGEIGIYARESGGKAFSGSLAFRFPDDSVRMGFGCYYGQARLGQMNREEDATFPTVLPDFILLLDNYTLQGEQVDPQVWLDNGVKLIWTLNVNERNLVIHRRDGSVSIFENLDRIVSGEDVLSGFNYDLAELN